MFKIFKTLSVRTAIPAIALSISTALTLTSCAAADEPPAFDEGQESGHTTFTIEGAQCFTSRTGLPGPGDGTSLANSSLNVYILDEEGVPLSPQPQKSVQKVGDLKWSLSVSLDYGVKYRACFAIASSVGRDADQYGSFSAGYFRPGAQTCFLSSLDKAPADDGDLLYANIEVTGGAQNNSVVLRRPGIQVLIYALSDINLTALQLSCGSSIWPIDIPSTPYSPRMGLLPDADGCYHSIDTPSDAKYGVYNRLGLAGSYNNVWYNSSIGKYKMVWTGTIILPENVQTVRLGYTEAYDYANDTGSWYQTDIDLNALGVMPNSQLSVFINELGGYPNGRCLDNQAVEFVTRKINSKY